MAFKQPKAEDLTDMIKINDIAKKYEFDPVDLATIQNAVVFTKLEHTGIPSFENMRKTVTHTLLEWLCFSKPEIGFLILSWFVPAELLIHKPQYTISLHLTT